MKCEDVSIFLPSFIKKELSFSIQKEISYHIKNCPECQFKKNLAEILISHLIFLEEEVPFFLKNRLQNIPELCERNKTKSKSFFLPRWILISIGSFLLFFNLFYFTNIYPAGHKSVHVIVSKANKIISFSESIFDNLQNSKKIVFFTFYRSRDKDASQITSVSIKSTNNKGNRVKNNG